MAISGILQGQSLPQYTILEMYARLPNECALEILTAYHSTPKKREKTFKLLYLKKLFTDGRLKISCCVYEDAGISMIV